MKKVCLSAEGRGRLEHSKGRHLFEFESLLDKSKRKWSLGMDLPVIGQEVLFFTYPEFANKKTRVSGTFANRLKIDIKSSTQKKELNQFFLMVGELLSIMHDQKLRKNWSLSEKSKRLVLERKLGKNKVFRFEAYDTSGYFRKLALSLGPANKFGKSKKLTKMTLFLSQCSDQ